MNQFLIHGFNRLSGIKILISLPKSASVMFSARNFSKSFL